MHEETDIVVEKKQRKFRNRARERYYITKVATQTRGENIGYSIKVPGTIGFTYHISNKDKFQMDQDLNIKH